MGKGSSSAPAPAPVGQTAASDLAAQKAAAGFQVQNYTPDVSGPGGTRTYQKYDLPDVNIAGVTQDGGQGLSGVNTAFSADTAPIYGSIINAAQKRSAAIPTSEWNPDIDASKLRQSYIDQGWQDYAPEEDRQQKQLNVTMAERGIPLGSEIYNDQANRMDEQRQQYGRSLTNAATQAAATEQQRQFGNELTKRQLASAETTGLLNQGGALLDQLYNGSSVQVATPTIQATDVAGLQSRNDALNAQTAAANNANQSSLWGGALGALGKIGGAYVGTWSDERLKEDIEQVGKTNDGQPIYTYQYKDDPSNRTQMGLLAQEVEKKHPEAVGERGGFLTVDYAKATKGAAKPSLGKMLRGKH